jgi:hypothetical protein
MLKHWHPMFEHLQRFAQRKGLLPKFTGREINAGSEPKAAIGG